MDNTNTPGDPNRPRAGWNAGARPRKAARRQEKRGQGDPTRRTPPPEQPTQRRQPPPRPSGHEYTPRNQPPPWSQERTQRTPPPRQDPPRQERPRQEQPRQEHPTEHIDREEPRRGAGADGPAPPDKISVARVAAWRARQGVHLFKKATQADGAGESGLSQLTYAYMLSYGSTAALSVALANTLFFAAANAESKTKVFLYLLITIAPFALVAPVIGPLLDRIRRGRRIAMAVACAGQAICAVVIALNYNSWVLYPAALAFMVLDKSFTVLKAAVTPRVLPSSSTLVTTNARLTTFGLIASGAFGAVAAGLAYIASSQGALVFCALIAVADAVLCMRIPSWVEDTKDEVPASLTATMEIPRDTGTGKRKGRKPRQSMGRNVVLALWANATIKLLTGFMVLFGAFVVKAETVGSPFQQMLLLALVAGSAGAGSFVGNAIGARIPLRKPDQILVVGICASLAATVVAALLAGVFTAAIVGLIGGAASAMVKICLDSVIQSDLPERSRASAFGRSETVVQLAWVIGGAIGVLLPAKFWLGFTVISVLLAIGLAQVLLTRQGRSLIPGFGGDRPVRPEKVDDSPLPKRQRTPTRTMPTEQL